MQQLMRNNPWPVNDPEALGQPLDEPWYIPLRQALASLRQEQDRLFGGSLASWLRGEGDEKRQ